MGTALDDRKANLLKEYDNLRSEIMSQISLVNNLQTFTITTVVAIISLALSQEGPINPYLFLIPFCILIPMSSRIANFRFGELKISAYMTVFLESEIDGYNWETRQSRLNYHKSRQDQLNLGLGKLYFTSFGNAALGMVCAALFYYFYCVKLGVEVFSMDAVYTQVIQGMSFRRVIVLLLPVAAVLLTFMTSVHARSGNEYRSEWKKLWEEVKKKEQEQA